MNQAPIDTQQVQLKSMQDGALSADWLIWLLALICVWPGLGAYGVLNNNEGLYASIPFDMLYSGDWRHWIIPHLNGLPYMEKPPMMYWLTAIAMLIFGQAEWVVRLVPTLSGLACVASVLYFGKRSQHPQVGRLAALMFISGLGVACLSRTLLFDIPLAAFLTAALVFAYFYLLDNQKRDLRFAYASLALGVLTKGLVAVMLFGLIVLAWLVLTYGWSAWKHFSKWFEPIAVGVFFVIVLPWIVAASWIEPIFPWFFFINEHVYRFLGERLPHDYYSGPWWYYLPRLILYLFPWSLLAPIVLLSSFSRRRSTGAGTMKVRLALMLAWLIPLLFFSASSNKANYYVVVVMPFAALSLAFALERCDFLAGKKNLILGCVIAALAAGAAVMLQFFPNRFLLEAVASDTNVLGVSLRDFVLAVLWILTGLAVIAAWLAWRIAKVGLVAYVMLPIFLLAVVIVKLNADDETVSNRSLAQFIQQTLPNHTVFLYRHFEQNSSLSFYLRKPLNMIESRSNDLYWGNKLRPGNKIVMSSEQFARENAGQDKPAAVLVPSEYVDEFKQQSWAGRFTHSKRYSRATLFY